jgi:hypothetical protein
MPISEAIELIVVGKIKPRDAVQSLMLRTIKEESL